MYDFSWRDPLTWIAVGIPVVIFATIVIAIWELLKWIWS